jgi:hypothetical protein
MPKFGHPRSGCPDGESGPAENSIPSGIEELERVDPRASSPYNVMQEVGIIFVTVG